jgi:exodeoxyribonuclease-3
MLIATFNCNSVRMRVDTILGWLEANKPDVLALQETKVEDHLFPRAAFEAAGYHVAFRGMKAYNGVALLSRAPPQDVRFGFADEPADDFRIQRATIGGVTIVNTYVPQGRAIDHAMFQYKLAWFRRLRTYFASQFSPTDPVVWLGDINVAAEPIDVHNPEKRARHVCYHADARAAFADLRAWGFVDVFRKHNPGPGHYTFFDYRTLFAAEKGDGWRIDYIFATPPLAERSRRAWIDMAPRLCATCSDHTFLAAEFQPA